MFFFNILWSFSLLCLTLRAFHLLKSDEERKKRKKKKTISCCCCDAEREQNVYWFSFPRSWSEILFQRFSLWLTNEEVKSKYSHMMHETRKLCFLMEFVGADRAERRVKVMKSRCSGLPEVAYQISSLQCHFNDHSTQDPWKPFSKVLITPFFDSGHFNA